jgi:alanine dehydrogenase
MERREYMKSEMGKSFTSTTIGFPRMIKEAGEKRVFQPEFIHYLTRLGANIYIEEGYGSRSGFTFEDYQRADLAVHQCTHEEAFQQDYVMVLRSPDKQEMRLLKKGSCIISMLHYSTRPKRVQLLNELGARSISLDSIVNDKKIRLVEDMKAVAWNGLEVAFDILEKHWPSLDRGDGNPIHVLVIGTGMVGKHAVDAATKLGNVERNNDHIRNGGLGSVALSVGRNITSNAVIMEKLFRQADILVDAAQRRNPARPVVPNEWIAWLPEHAVVTDLSVDPYTLDIDPPVVRGIEGIPQGNLDQYIFTPNDPKWDTMVPPSVPSQQRRTTVTCYSWPGIHPDASMLHYGQQLEPLIKVLLEKGYENLSLDGDYFERALYRATLHGFESTVVKALVVKHITPGD